MPNYRIYRMKESPRQHFRSAPHVSGAANVKRRDYDESGQIEAANEYAAWDHMRSTERPWPMIASLAASRAPVAADLQVHWLRSRGVGASTSRAGNVAGSGRYRAGRAGNRVYFDKSAPRRAGCVKYAWET